MVVQMQILSVHSMEMAPSLLLSTETQRFLFNVGDGTQRMCMEHHVRLAKLKNVFLTELRTHTVGGLPGMILTVSDTGKDSLTVYGPEGTGRYLHATRHFLYRPQFALKATDLPRSDTKTGSPCYSDAEISVFPVVVTKHKTGAKRKLHTGASSESLTVFDSAAADESYVNDCVSYIVETPTQRGKFLVEKAIALGVPKGKLFGQLHQGKNVTLPDGRVVTSSECVSPSLPGSGCAIITCPSVTYVNELVQSEGFRRYQRSSLSNTSSAQTEPEIQLQVIYHLGGPQVLSHPKYIEWVQRFGDNVDHVALHANGVAQKTVYRASAKLQAQLYDVFPHAFPSNKRTELRDSETPFSRKLEMDLSPNKSVILGESMLKYIIAPTSRQGFDASACWARIDYDDIQTTTAAVKETLQIKHTNTNSSSTDRTDSSKSLPVNGRITFLGTGCAIPSKYRNVTGMYLELMESADGTEWNGMMLDCGEGSFGQLYRYADNDTSRLQELVNKLKCIWISHNHADHHLGMLRMLSERSLEEGTEPVLIIAPTPVEFWLKEYAALDPTIMGKYMFVDNYWFNDLDDRFQEVIATSKPTRLWLKETFGITQFECVPVKHAFLSYALVMTFNESFKIAFSGDCRPSDQFAAKASDAFLMVHEATFEDSLAQEAKQKDHCTTSEAIAVGQKARVKHLILTHFSQRYPKMPVMDETNGSNDVLTAIDMLSLRFQELKQPDLMEVCSQLMTKDDEEETTPLEEND